MASTDTVVGDLVVARHSRRTRRGATWWLLFPRGGAYGRTLAPYGTTLASQGIREVPHGTTLAPYGTTLASQGIREAPHGTTLAPYGRTLAPYGTTLAP